MAIDMVNASVWMVVALMPPRRIALVQEVNVCKMVACLAAMPQERLCCQGFTSGLDRHETGAKHTITGRNHLPHGQRTSAIPGKHQRAVPATGETPLDGFSVNLDDSTAACQCEIRRRFGG